MTPAVYEVSTWSDFGGKSSLQSRKTGTWEALRRRVIGLPDSPPPLDKGSTTRLGKAMGHYDIIRRA
jgi:hypothetical protein